MNSLLTSIGEISLAAVAFKQIISKAFNLPDRFSGLLELGISVAAALFFVGITKDAVGMGIIAGFSAAGVWNGATALGIKFGGGAPDVAGDDVVPTPLPQA